MYRSRTHIAMLTLAAITILWISGTLGQDPAADPDPISSSRNVPRSGEVSDVGGFPGGESVPSSGSASSRGAVARDPFGGGTSSRTAFPSGGTAAINSTASSSGYSSASVTSDGQTGSVFTDMFPSGGTEPDPLREADQRFVQSTRDLVARYQGATDSGERDLVRQQLNQLLVEHFEVRQQMRAHELEELEAQVRRLRELHDRREQEKDQIVRDRLQQLVRDAEGLGWGSSEGVPGLMGRTNPLTPGSSTTPARRTRPARPR